MLDNVANTQCASASASSLLLGAQMVLKGHMVKLLSIWHHLQIANLPTSLYFANSVL